MRAHTHTHTYIGNDRELADSTENIVPNPWRQHVHEKRKSGKEKYVHVCVCVCYSFCICLKEKDKTKRQSGGVRWSKGNESD